MSRNLAKKGQLDKPIVLWTRTISNADTHSSDIGHASVAKSAEEAVANSDMIWSCLVDETAVRQVYDRILKQDVKGKLFVECSTVTPEASNELCAKVLAAGAEFVSMPGRSSYFHFNPSGLISRCGDSLR